MDITSYKHYLVGLIEARALETAVILPIDNYPEWAEKNQVPRRVVDHAIAHGLTPPPIERWMMLTPLQRFALFKLTRPGHDNDNFVPAMQEFGFSNERD